MIRCGVTPGLLILMLNVGCNDPPGSTLDGGADAGGRDARVDAAPADAAADGGTLWTRDAESLPCEAPGYHAPHTARFRNFHMSPSGHPGGGLDLDNDPTTCSPGPPGCSGGIDNQAGSMSVEGCYTYTITYLGFNILMDYLMEDGRPPETWIVEARGLVMSGDDSEGPFDLVLHHGQWFPSPDCTDSASVIEPGRVCDYLVDDEWLSWGTCTPLAVMDNAVIIDGVLTAGDDNTTLWINYNVQGIIAGIAIHRAHIQADVTLIDDELSLSHGILAGVVCPRDMVSLLAALVHIDDPVACGLEQKLPVPDMEVGCSPGTGPDGLSTAFLFEAHPANIVGLLRD